MLDVKAIYERAKKKIDLDDPKPISWVLPTGSLFLNQICGVGGYPSGRIVELFGQESGGKSTLAMSACVEAEKLGVPFAYIDMEQSLDVGYFHKLGLKGEPNVDWMHITPETGEDAIEVVRTVLKEGIRVVVVDSVAAMVSKAELSGESGDANMGAQARMMSQGMRLIAGQIAQAEAVVLFVNQTRMKLSAYGNPETTAGGAALKFYASLRISVKTVGEPIADLEGNLTGRTARCKVVKNKCAPPLRECEIPILWGVGIDRYGEMLDLAVQEGVIAKTSSYYTYKDLKVNGRQNMLKALVSVYENVKEDIDRKWGAVKPQKSGKMQKKPQEKALEGVEKGADAPSKGVEEEVPLG